ncbi:hypothetical protein GCM10009590_27890 [Brachybacterium alimentarium]
MSGRAPFIGAVPALSWCLRPSSCGGSARPLVVALPALSSDPFRRVVDVALPSWECAPTMDGPR